ncbi:Fe-S cluster assembly protein SufB, partial [Patescibacteria group bacterium]|nr:Fe-S cluster assembly protein SufB [Patescibacteria group bacterium]
MKNFNFKDKDSSILKFKKGLSKDTIKNLSKIKNEPKWMLEIRLKAYELFLEKPMPNWGADLSQIDFNDIYYYSTSSTKEEKTWEQVPTDIKRTFDRIGIPK